LIPFYLFFKDMMLFYNIFGNYQGLIEKMKFETKSARLMIENDQIFAYN